MKAYVLVGNSTRLPRKHLVEVIRGRRLIDLVVDNLKNIGFEVVVYSKYPIDVDAQVLMDREEWILPSVISLFSRDESFFLFGGDMPLVKRDAVEKIINHPGHGTKVPMWRETGYLEPLHAYYTRDVLPCLKREAKMYGSLTRALKSCRNVHFIPAEELGAETFFNVNTRDDLEALKSKLKRNSQNLK